MPIVNFDPKQAPEQLQAILRADATTLSGPESVLRDIARTRGAAMPCPICRTPINQYVASRGPRLLNDSYSGPYVCTDCGIDLVVHIPHGMKMFEPGWLWHLTQVAHKRIEAMVRKANKTTKAAKGRA